MGGRVNCRWSSVYEAERVEDFKRLMTRMKMDQTMEMRTIDNRRAGSEFGD